MLRLSVTADSPTEIQVYWAGAMRPFDESNSRRLRILTDKRHYSLPLTDLRDIERLRIDPSMQAGVRLQIHNLSIYQDGLKSVEFGSRADFEQVLAIRGIQQITARPEGLVVITADDDGQLEYALEMPVLFSHGWTMLARALIVVGILALVMRASRRKRSQVHASCASRSNREYRENMLP